MAQHSNDVRVTAHMPGHIKQTIDKAAVLRGVSVTQFLVHSAKQQLAEEHLIQLDRDNSAAFVAALDQAALNNFLARTASFSLHRADLPPIYPLPAPGLTTQRNPIQFAVRSQRQGRDPMQLTRAQGAA